MSKNLRILFLGDIVAACGREAVMRCAPVLREVLELDLLCANAENSAHGFGLTPKIAENLLESGLDLLTSGNHIWDQPQIIDYLRENPTAPILRPLNMDSPSHNPLPGRGYADLEIAAGKRVRVINVIGRVFLEPCEHPFFALESLLSASAPMEDGFDALLIDFHAEATGEKLSLARLCDGRASAVLGTHTHIPSADTCILARGLAYQSDIGMCGCYDSIIGMDSEKVIERYLKHIPRSRLEPAHGVASLSGIFIEIDSTTGYAKYVEPFRLAANETGMLSTAMPKECLPYKQELQRLLSSD